MFPPTCSPVYPPINRSISCQYCAHRSLGHSLGRLARQVHLHSILSILLDLKKISVSIFHPCQAPRWALDTIHIYSVSRSSPLTKLGNGNIHEMMVTQNTKEIRFVTALDLIKSLEQVNRSLRAHIFLSYHLK